jgi:DNA-binding transcriptional MerR regulator
VSTTTTNELTIAEVAGRSGVSAHTLRYYERIGLLDPVGRDDGGRRRYGAEDLNRLEMLQKLRRTGMPLQRIAEYVELIRRGDGTEAARLDLLEAHRVQVLADKAVLEDCLAFLDRKIDLYRRSAP